ncbi:polyketide cyclase / dehydrase and lipid transport [Antrihabitans stalactiti]|jgi:hypothetical protein|uniref:Polyketide cyclase / dehydrase and lipid transport n=1 Tax=Antrihabitans stalactiti TaxID=2584121 RepID=A0A848KDT0_9NOCA|nr:polyketide cyclase / dehydrase and lipid transport [Antrihabitans stalactiti]
MSSIQVADQTFVAAPAARVAAAVASPSQWRNWWPDLTLGVSEDRGENGIRWTVAGALSGTMEVWLEPSLDGVILHYFLHAEPTGQSYDGPRDLLAAIRARRVAGRRMSFEVKGKLEAGRRPGEPPA